MSKAFDEWWDKIGDRLGPESEVAREAWNAALRHAAKTCRNEACGYNDNGIAQDALILTADQLEREAES